MKERIIFKTESSIKGRKEIAKINEYVNNFNFDCEFERKIEQEPESWEELEKLVIDNCSNYAIEIDNTKKRYSIEYKGLVFYNFGVVEFSIATKTIDGDFVKFNRCFATDMQPAQMWAIIKNL